MRMWKIVCIDATDDNGSLPLTSPAAVYEHRTPTGCALEACTYFLRVTAATPALVDVDHARLLFELGAPLGRHGLLGVQQLAHLAQVLAQPARAWPRETMRCSRFCLTLFS